MVFDGKLSSGTCLCWKSAFGPAVISRFDLFTSKSNWFIFIPNYINVANLHRNSHKWFVRYRANRLLVYDYAQMDKCTDSSRKQNAYGGEAYNSHMKKTKCFELSYTPSCNSIDIKVTLFWSADGLHNTFNDS